MRAKTKAKRARKASHTTRNRAPRRRQALESVAPVAVQRGDSAAVVIPATVNGDSDSPKAVIAVEVKRGNKVRKRAAVIPVAVRKRPKAVERAQTGKHGRSDETRWSDPITDSVLYGTRVAESFIGFAHQIGTTAIDTVEGLSRALFARLTERATAITSVADKTAAEIEFAAFSPITNTRYTERLAA